MRTTSLKAILTAAALTAATGAFAQDGETVVRVALEPSSGPFVVMDLKNKQLTGFDVELMRAIAEASRFKIKFIPMTFDKIIPSVRTGTVDAGISSITITPERQKYLAFSEPYIKAGLAIMIRRDMADKIVDEDDLEGHDICAQGGTLSSKYASRINEVDLKEYNSNAEIYMALREGKCQAVINERPILNYYMAFVKPKDVLLLDGYVTSEEYAIAMNRNDFRVQTLINSGMRKIRENGTYQEIYDRWFTN